MTDEPMVPASKAVDLAFVAHAAGVREGRSESAAPEVWRFSGQAGLETRFEMTITGAPCARSISHIIRQLEVTRDILAEDEAIAREQREHSSPLPTEGDKSRDEQAPTVSADPGGSHE